jgi:hypothetical protein
MKMIFITLPNNASLSGAWMHVKETSQTTMLATNWTQYGGTYRLRKQNTCCWGTSGRWTNMMQLIVSTTLIAQAPKPRVTHYVQCVNQASVIGQHMQSSLHSTRKQKDKLSKPIFPKEEDKYCLHQYCKSIHQSLNKYIHGWIWKDKKKLRRMLWVLLDCSSSIERLCDMIF